MASVTISKNDQIMMSLVHYFVTKENYAPIHVQGVKDEIWLENLEGPYRIIRISCNSIINEEQYKFDIFKMKHIMKQIKKKTLSFKVNALNICLDMSKKVELKLDKSIETITADSLNEIRNNEELKEVFPSINEKLIETDDGLELIINVTNDINEKTEKENKKFSEVFSPKKIIFTKIIMLICVFMYFFVAIYGGNFIDFDPNLLAYLGGSYFGGEIWRVITSTFLHAGLIHLIVNMYSLYIIGPQVESFIGKWKFVFIYLLSAICGGLMSMVFIEPNVVSIGASGAIFGLMGALLYFGYHYRLYLSDAMKSQIIPVIVINLVMGYFLGFDNAAHVGGLIGGYLAAMAIGIKNKSTKKDMLNGSVVLVLYVAFLTYIIYFVR